MSDALKVDSVVVLHAAEYQACEVEGTLEFEAITYQYGQSRGSKSERSSTQAPCKATCPALSKSSIRPVSPCSTWQQGHNPDRVLRGARGLNHSFNQRQEPPV